MSVVNSDMLAAGPGLGDLGHAECQRLVIRECREGATLDEEPEVPHGEVHRQELAVEGAVLGLRLAQLLAEETQGLPVALHLLLENGAYHDVRVSGRAWTSIVASASVFFVAMKACSMLSVQTKSAGFGFPAMAWKRGRMSPAQWRMKRW